MPKTLIRLFLAVGAVLHALAFPGIAGAQQNSLKVGFVYVSPIGDAGWSYQHDLGRKELEKNLGDKVKASHVESVSEGPDAERVIRDLARQGNKLIIATSFDYMNPTLKVARQFPDVKFVHITGYKTDKNVAVVNARFYEGRYLAGVLAGEMSSSNVAGYVAAFPTPEVLRGINAFARGMRSVNPNAEVRVIWVHSWYDPGKERDAALTLLSQGADVITHHTDSTAVVQAAEERGRYAIAYHSDMSKFAPKAHLAAVTHHWGPQYLSEAQAVLNNNWKTHAVWGGIKDGMVRLEGWGPSVPAEVKDVVLAREKDIVSGRLTPFDAPVKDNQGQMRLTKGSLSDAELNRMDYYVEGIVGRVPGK